MKMDDSYFNKYAAIAIIAVLVFLTFIMVRPVLFSIIMAFILALILWPVYNWIYKKTNLKNISSLIVCAALVLIILIPLWFVLPILLDQALKIYISLQTINFNTLFQDLFPTLFPSAEISSEFASIFSSFVSSTGSSILNSISGLIFNFPMFLLQFMLVFFILFFVLRDAGMFVKYIKDMLPFPKEIKEKLFSQSQDITVSILYGQIIMGIIQGIIAGIGFFIFGVPNALFLTILASIAGILPIVGTTLVWVPIAVYLLVAGNLFAAAGVAIFGLLSSGVENFVRPIIVSYKIALHPALVLVGMIGGLILWGFLGIVIGPLILAYLIIILELYRKKKSGVFIKIPSEVH
jgi:predicted PurR-regulated permease PerM